MIMIIDDDDYNKGKKMDLRKTKCWIYVADNLKGKKPKHKKMMKKKNS